MNTDGSEDYLFIANHEEEVKETDAEADQIIAEVDMKRKMILRLWMRKRKSMSLLVIFPQSHLKNQMIRKRKKKKFRVCNSTIIEWEISELIEAFQEELDESIFSKRLEDGVLNKFYGIKKKKRLSASEI